MLKRILLALDSSDSGQVAISFTMALAAPAPRSASCTSTSSWWAAGG